MKLVSSVIALLVGCQPFACWGGGGQLGAIAVYQSESGGLPWTVGGRSAGDAVGNLKKWLEGPAGLADAKPSYVCDRPGWYVHAVGSKEYAGQFEIPYVIGLACGYPDPEDAKRGALDQCEQRRRGSLPAGKICLVGRSVQLPGYTTDYQRWWEK